MFLLSYQNKTDVYVEDRLVFRDNYHLQDTLGVSVKQAMNHMQVFNLYYMYHHHLVKITTIINGGLVYTDEFKFESNKA